MARVLIIGALPRSLVNFRGDLISAMVSLGHQVTAMAATAEPEQIKQIEKLGAEFLAYPVARNSLNPVQDLKTFLALRKAMRSLKPDVVVAYTIKPVIWGGLAALTIPSIRFTGLITGLGFAFEGHSLRRRLLTKIVSLMYKSALWRAEKVIFQNQDNRNLFVERNIVEKQKCIVVNGSGVNLDYFSYSEPPSTDLTFLVIARLLKAKGLFEFVDAARKVKQQNKNASFQILGPADPSPDGIDMNDVRRWQEEGIIEYLGEADDVRPFIEKCSVFVLPSYHEGMPRTVLEAMAMGRPVLTTDVPGCRATVRSGANGFLVPAKDAQALADKMIWFFNNRDQLRVMGQTSRKIAEERFDVKRINRQMLIATKLLD